MNTHRPSKSRVDRAGEVIRARRAAGDHGPRKYRAALGDMDAFRALWASAPQPLAKVSMGLRSMALSALKDPAAIISQRLKRLDRIIERLLRPEHRTMRLSQMEDIGGCRVVVPTLDDRRRVRARVNRLWARNMGKSPYRDAERRHEADKTVHVVLISADSLATVKRTHPNYWSAPDLRKLVRRAAGG